MATLFGKTVMKLLPAKSLRRALVSAASDHLRWKLALPCEEKYWETYIAQQGGGAWGADFVERTNPIQPLQAHVAAHIAAPGGATVKILDVGAGPLTVLGKTWVGRNVEITAVDPLANDYHRLLRRHGVRPPVPTQYCEAEKLAARFGRDVFDLVYSRNALDHSYNPLEALRQMVAVCKPGGVALLEHLINEGETEKYYGLHQWNFCCQEQRFVIWNRIHRYDVAAELGAAVRVTTRVAGSWLTVLLRKSA